MEDWGGLGGWGGSRGTPYKEGGDLRIIWWGVGNRDKIRRIKKQHGN